MKDSPEKKQTGRVNWVRGLAGGYLLYLAFKLVRGIVSGGTSMVLLSILGALAFAAVGGWLVYQEWTAYKFGQAHIDDPETWSDEAAEEAALPEDAEKGGEDA